MEKEKIPVETVSPVSPSKDDVDEKQQRQPETEWNPGFFARFPWIGFSALFFVLICTAASVIVLVESNGRSQSHWPKDVSPNVLLNLMNNIENVCFTIAVTTGVAIAWWRKALKGSTIEDLHNSFAFGTSFGSLFSKIKYFNIIALAAVTAKLTIVDSTLMQRATSNILAMDPGVPVSNLTGFVNDTFPITGTVDGNSSQPGLLMHWMGDNLRMWDGLGGMYPLQWTGCEGLCYVNVPTIGFAFECDDPVVTDINYGDTLQGSPKGTTETLFSLKFDAVYALPGSQDSSYLHMWVAYAAADSTESLLSCPGKLYNRTCKLLPAIINYPIQIMNETGQENIMVSPKHHKEMNMTTQNNDLTRYNETLKQQNGFEVVRLLNIQEDHVHSKDINSTLAGIQIGLDMYLSGESTVTWQNGFGYKIDQTGHAANFMTDPPSNPLSCAFDYTDPLNAYHAPNGLFSVPSVVAKINEIMFGLATDVSRDDPNNNYNDVRQFSGTEFKQNIHYKTHFPYMFGAIASTIACVLLVLPVYWGFWELGRKVTLGPFEIAHAFRSPITAHAHNATADELIQEVGGNQIKYGPIVAGDGRGVFGVSTPANVATAVPSPRPAQGETFRQSWRTI